MTAQLVSSGKPRHEFGYRPFPEAQMQALISLSTDILARYSIAARNVWSF